jgi:alkylation response protein AidB-like acyl-CoA dehydrogenase
VFIEVKKPGWNAPKQPKPDASASTREKFRHHQEQVQFQARQIARGHLAFFARSAFEVYQRLTEYGFLGLPVPQEVPSSPKAPATRPKPSKGILRAARGAK